MKTRSSTASTASSDAACPAGTPCRAANAHRMVPPPTAVGVTAEPRTPPAAIRMPPQNETGCPTNRVHSPIRRLCVTQGTSASATASPTAPADTGPTSRK